MAVFLGIWVGALYYQASVYGEAESAAEFGDKFGAVNALFSGLALIGVVVAIILQQRELSASTIELRNSSNALGAQVELAANAAVLQALPVLIARQTLIVRQFGATRFPHLLNQELSEAILAKALQDLALENKGSEVRIAQLQAEIAELENRGSDTLATVVAGIRKKELNEVRLQLNCGIELVPELNRLHSYTAEMNAIFHKMKSTTFSTDRMPTVA